MTYPDPNFSVNVDVTNPGQFFACCGLLELAHRLWPDSEGWFDLSNSMFAISTKDTSATFEHLKDELSKCDISGLSEEERQERETLEAENKKTKKERERLEAESKENKKERETLETHSRERKEKGQELPIDKIEQLKELIDKEKRLRELHGKEERRKELGAFARGGAIRLGKPFNIVLNWWQTDDEDATAPKTWAGLQELHKVARAVQDAVSEIGILEELLNYSCVLRMPREYCKKDADHKKPVEPFYFDARRFAHALDTGFSLDVQDAETTAHPAVELLCLIGLQRFRPATTSNKWVFEYSVWQMPLLVPVASAMAGCAVPAGHRYRFRLLFRDDQKRYKAFDFANPIGD